MTEESESGEEIEEMFVQSAGGVGFHNSTLTLHGVSPAVLFFADRPDREVGHLTWDDFVSEWGDGENSFAADPPNAVLTFLEPGGDVPEDVTMVLRDPELSGDSVSYSVEVLDGSPPAGSARHEVSQMAVTADVATDPAICCAAVILPQSGAG